MRGNFSRRTDRRIDTRKREGKGEGEGEREREELPAGDRKNGVRWEFWCDKVRLVGGQVGRPREPAVYPVAVRIRLTIVRRSIWKFISWKNLEERSGLSGQHRWVESVVLKGKKRRIRFAICFATGKLLGERRPIHSVCMVSTISQEIA
jgi:hypothetical protein